MIIQNVLGTPIYILDFVFIEPFLKTTTLFPVVTRIVLSGSELIQPILTFNDLIDFLYHGQSIQTLIIEGVIATENTLVEAHNEFANLLASLRGKTFKISLGLVALEVILSRYSLQYSQNQTVGLISYSMECYVVSSNLYPRFPNLITCTTSLSLKLVS